MFRKAWVEMLEQLQMWAAEEISPKSSKISQNVLQNLLSEDTFTESKEAYERRRVVEMAKKLGWCHFVIAPWKNWRGVEISEGEIAWHAFLGEASSVAITWVMIDLQKMLNPLTRESIDEKTGLWKYPVEVTSRVDERDRTRMIRLAEALEWPHISYWEANETRVVGPGKEAWNKYASYGCLGTITDLVSALERRLRGEPDKVKSNKKQRSDEEDEEGYTSW